MSQQYLKEVYHADLDGVQAVGGQLLAALQTEAPPARDSATRMEWCFRLRAPAGARSGMAV
jgi:hypothetical protein